MRISFISGPSSLAQLAQAGIGQRPASPQDPTDDDAAVWDGSATPAIVPPLPEPVRESRSLPLFDRILPKLEGPRPELRFAGRRSIVHQGLQRFFGDEHKVYSAIGIGANAYAILLALAHDAMLSGGRAFLDQYRRHAATQGHVPVAENHFIGIARRHFLHGIEVYARAMALDVVIEGAEKIPADGIVMQLAANHASIFPDFLFAWADPRFAPVADAGNFSYNKAARRTGAALYFDLLGLPFIRRHDDGNGDAQRRITATDELSRRLTQLMTVRGVRPIFFGQGGRAPTAYEEDGSQGPAGFYANAPDPKRPEVSFQAGGVIVAAARVARQTGRDVALAVVSMRGSERVMPKHAAKAFPFFGPSRTGERITYRVVDVLTITPTERRLSAIATRATELLRSDLEIDPYLDAKVGDWAAEAGRPELGAAFSAIAARDERWHIIADRIRSVHPRREQRALFKHQLLQLAADAGEGRVPEEALRELLADVTAAIRG